MTATYLLSANFVTAILKKDPQATDLLRAELAANARILISAVTYYEIKRGLLKRDATRQLAAFEEMVSKLEWLDVERAHWEAAVAMWAGFQKVGKPVNDADLLWAVQAHQSGAILITDDDNSDGLNVTRD
jgi:tRNA(fMet)-specific endonuclease VapC